MLDQTAIQSPANSGQLADGQARRRHERAIGFDIYAKVRNGTTVQVSAFASLTGTDGRARWYRVDLLQGRATEVGRFGRDDQVTGVAIKLDR